MSIPVGADAPVSPTQYVEWNGTGIEVFDKTTGDVLYGPAAGTTLFRSLGGACATRTDGDPKAAYDVLAKRWVLARFVAGATPGDAHQCVAVSVTEDATGPYELYDFAIDATGFADHPKLDVRPDGYSMTVHAKDATGTSVARTYVFDRTQMVQGLTARMRLAELPAVPAAPAACTPGSCDDNNPCTVDTCDPVLGCLYAPANCDDGNACTVDVCSPSGGPLGPAVLFIGHDTTQLERQYQKIGTFVQTWGAIGNATGAAIDGNGVVYICNPDFGNNVIERRGPGNVNLGTITATVNNQFIEDLGNFTGSFILAGTFEGDVYRIDTTTGAHILQFSTGQQFIGVTYDGTNIWTTGGYTSNLIHRRNLSGTVLSTFNTGRPNFAIGYDPDDGTLWIGHASGQVTHYSQSGTLLGGFSTQAGGGLIDGVELGNLELPAGCQNNALDCNDNDPCTLDACDPITGCYYAPNLCDDNNPCTDDACTAQNGCVYTNNNGPCDDGDLCNIGDTCSGGLCLPGTPVVCNDNNVCTTDSCDPRFGCGYIFNTNFCDDGDACTIEDVCLNGGCQPGFPVVCNDGNACTTDTCIPPTGCVFVPDTGSPCDDGNACTTGEVCVGGTCQLGVGIACTASDQCHVPGICDPGTGVCSNPPAPNGTACNDGNPCTGGDACVGGVCAGGTVIAVPAETQNVSAAANKSTYNWPAASDATAFDALRGNIAALPVGSSAGGEVCFHDLLDPVLVDTAIPAPGAGFWYLVRPRNPCGYGPIGIQSNGTARVTTTCP